MNPMTRQFSNMGILVRNYEKNVLDNVVLGSYIFAKKKHRLLLILVTFKNALMHHASLLICLNKVWSMRFTNVEICY